MMKHLKQLHGIRGLLPYLKTKRPTVLLIFFLSMKYSDVNALCSTQG